MDTRAYQVFRCYLEEDEELELESSPWYGDGDAVIPLEHWDALQALADERHYVDWSLWDDMSDLDEFCCDQAELQMFTGGLKELQKFLRIDMMVMLDRTKTCPEPLPGFEHARMLGAVLAVLEAAQTDVESFVEE